MNSLLNSTIWSAIQRFGGLVIGFVSNVVLARLLCPEDYGIVGLIMVFIAIADVLVDGGLGNALIQKKDISQEDISTVFTSNLVISLFFFLLIFFSAPYIASYIEIANFSLFLRVQSLMVLLRAFFLVHYSLMNKQMEFKKLAIINLIVSLISTIIAISMALCGCGVWSLIVRNLSLDLFSLIIYCWAVKVKLSLFINLTSFRKLFCFGIFVAIANLVESLYSNILSFILGKRFSVTELGYYNQAYSLEQIPVYSLTSILNQVFFPFLSKEQDNQQKMRADVKNSILGMSFFIYPLMTFLICFAQPIIVLLYSEKWLPSVPFFQILCTLGFTNFIYHLNRSIMKAVGKSKVLFFTQIISCVIGLLLIIISISIGIYAVVAMVALNSIIGMLIVSYYAGQYINLNVYNQLKEVSFNLFLSLIIGVIVYAVFNGCGIHPLLLLPMAFLLFVFLYLFTHYILRSNSYKMVSSIILSHYMNKTTINNG